jgi:hypothetical protein
MEIYSPFNFSYDTTAAAGDSGRECTLAPNF